MGLSSSFCFFARVASKRHVYPIKSVVWQDIGDRTQFASLRIGIMERWNIGQECGSLTTSFHHDVLCALRGFSVSKKDNRLFGIDMFVMRG